MTLLVPFSAAGDHTARMTATPTPLSIEVKSGLRVSALLQLPPNARACYVLGHGAEHLIGLFFVDRQRSVRSGALRERMRKLV